jgi:hypothetical protein
MKPILSICAFLAAVLASPVLALAVIWDCPGCPITGTPVGLEHDPGSVVISQTKTNGEGVAAFKNVKPGKYKLAITINWGDGSKTGAASVPTIQTHKPVTYVQAAIINVNIPGQAPFKIAENESPRPVDRVYFVPFTIKGNEARTFTVTVTWGD